jgi:hypothetical protein
VNPVKGSILALYFLQSALFFIMPMAHSLMDAALPMPTSPVHQDLMARLEALSLRLDAMADVSCRTKLAVADFFEKQQIQMHEAKSTLYQAALLLEKLIQQQMETARRDRARLESPAPAGRMRRWHGPDELRTVPAPESHDARSAAGGSCSCPGIP